MAGPDRDSRAAGDEARLVVTLITGPSAEDLCAIGRRLVEERLAACVNVIPAVTSIFRWDEGVEETSEALGIVKTTADSLARLESRVLELHPYDLPEVLVLPVGGGLGAYLDWVRASVHEGRGNGKA